MARTRSKAKKRSAGKKKRDYKAEYRRRVARAGALGYSKSVARGHPKREQGEVGRAELRQLARAASKVLSPGQQRRVGIRRPVQKPVRVKARQRIAELVGIDLPRRKETRKTDDAKAFVEAAMALGIGNQEAWTLWFSP